MQLGVVFDIGGPNLSKNFYGAEIWEHGQREKEQGACEISWLKTGTSCGVGTESFLPIIIVLRGFPELKVK